MQNLFIFLFLVIGGIAAVIIASYNKLQALSQAVKARASDVQVSISKKLSLINQMIDLVKNYQDGEQFVQLKISQDTNTNNLASSYQQSGAVLTSLQGIAQRYPDLKSGGQYNNLSNSISACENDIQDKRVAYNEFVRVYNVTRSQLPTVLIASYIGFKEIPYLDMNTSGYQDPSSLNQFKTQDSERLGNLLSGNK